MGLFDGLLGGSFGLSFRDQELLTRQMLGAQAPLPLMGYMPPSMGIDLAVPGSGRTGIVMIKEGHMELKATIERIDDRHVLITAGCKKKVAHDRKELRKKVVELVDEYVLPVFEKK